MDRSPRRGDPSSDPTGVGEILRALLGEGPLREGARLGRLGRAWPAVVGEELAAQTAPLSLDEDGLLVAASSPAWAAQLRFLSEEIGRRSADALGEERPPRVRVVVGPNRPQRGR